MRIGILGGTFNPIHNGHIAMAKESMEQLQLDKILFMPSGNPPHKKQTDIVSDLHRSNMIQLGIDQELKEYHFEFSDIELKREGIIFTSDTLQILHEHYPDEEFFFILGSDSLFYIEQWHEPNIIFQLATIVVIGRDSKDCLLENKIHDKIHFLENEFHGRIIYLQTPLLDVSSSQIRELIQCKQSISQFVPEQVERYIMNHNLYTCYEG